MGQASVVASSKESDNMFSCDTDKFNNRRALMHAAQQSSFRATNQEFLTLGVGAWPFQITNHQTGMQMA